jgi:hypothetical protein
VEVYRGGAVDEAHRHRAISVLTLWIQEYAEKLRTERARYDLRARYLVRIVPWVWGLALTLTVLILFVDGDTWRSVAISAIAGAVGGTLSGFLRMRSAIRGTEMRAVHLAIITQPGVGAVMGLIVFLLFYSGLLSISANNATSGDWATFGVIAFVAGFSEPFALGLLGRAASLGGPTPADTAARPPRTG